MSRVVLVTGGAGYIGSHACLELEKCGYTPVVLDNLSRGHLRLASNYKFYLGSVSDHSVLKTIFEEQEICGVMHFAAFAYVGESVSDPDMYYENNVTGIISLLKAMRSFNVKNLVFSSTCAVYGNPPNLPITESTPLKPVSPYGITKLICEKIIGSYCDLDILNAVNFRYFNVIGNDWQLRAFEDHTPETHILPLLVDASLNFKEFLMFGSDYATRDGTCERDYIDVRDLVSAHVKAMHLLDESVLTNSTTLNLGVGTGYTNLELANYVSNITKKKIDVKFAQRRPGDAVALRADASKAKKILNWTPVFSILDSIRARIRYIGSL